MHICINKSKKIVSNTKERLNLPGVKTQTEDVEKS